MESFNDLLRELKRARTNYALTLSRYERTLENQIEFLLAILEENPLATPLTIKDAGCLVHLLEAYESEVDGGFGLDEWAQGSIADQVDMLSDLKSFLQKPREYVPSFPYTDT